MDLPRLDSDHPLMEFDTRRQLAGGEVLTYRHLFEVQGKTIPYMFGLFVVCPFVHVPWRSSNISCQGKYAQ